MWLWGGFKVFFFGLEGGIGLLFPIAVVFFSVKKGCNLFKNCSPKKTPRDKSKVLPCEKGVEGWDILAIFTYEISFFWDITVIRRDFFQPKRYSEVGYVLLVILYFLLNMGFMQNHHLGEYIWNLELFPSIKASNSKWVRTFLGVVKGNQVAKKLVKIRQETSMCFCWKGIPTSSGIYRTKCMCDRL